MNYDSLRNYMQALAREQEAKQRQELREQEAKHLEVENLAETRKLKEELSVIAAPPGWDIKKSIADDVDRINSDMVDDTESSDREYTIWLREIWAKEGCLTGAPFFKVLKNYKGEEDSLVIDWWNVSTKGPGVKLKTNTGEIELPRSQIQKIASRFKSEIRQNKLSIDN